jgi:signal transduction histidine kinase/ActR/RegA family two-component response regulator
MVLVAITPAWIIMYYTDFPWTGLALGVLALCAAWTGGEYLVLRPVRTLLQTIGQLTSGNIQARTGLQSAGELGELARQFDAMAARIAEGIQNHEKTEQTLLERSLQQTVVSALGQFAMANTDIPGLLDQAARMVTQTLEIEYCAIFELARDQKSLALRAGLGWMDGVVGSLVLPADPESEAGLALESGEPLIVTNLRTDTRVCASEFLIEHGVVSGATVTIRGHDKKFGVLGTYTGQERKFTGDEVNFLLAVGNIIAMAAARAEAEAELQKLASFAQLNPNPAMELAPDGKATYFNDSALDLAISAQVESPQNLLPDSVAQIVDTCLTTGEPRLRLDTMLRGKTLSWSFYPFQSRQLVHAYVEDVTERVSLQAQLMQSQKMQCVGQLAAGVAHDFNNMLTVIQGHTGMLLADEAIAEAYRESLQSISFAAERAGNLTRQLLLFSRKTVMQPRAADLRDLVNNLGKMLQRLLGENIRLTMEHPERLSLVRCDTGMVEQALMNLAVNARDAMPEGGALVIATEAVTIPEEYRKANPDSQTGDFVCLRVTDTGCGMDAATKARVFEPFFTTKEVGKGTGLGLATVYGIVKQHEGWIELESEPQKGTTFRLYLPSSSETASTELTDGQPEKVRGGNETILVVEDEPSLRNLANSILKDWGYQVLQAGSGPEALRIWERSHKAIDLLLTDMVMPDGMSGMDLTQRLHARKPSLKVVLTTGYSLHETDTVFFTRGASVFLPKPYTHLSLARAVRQCLDK